MTEQFKCWHCRDKWRTKKQLVKRKDDTHIDYECPVCGRVVICNYVG